MHELETRRHQRALNNELRLSCQIIAPCFPHMYNDLLDELEPWMQEVSLECPADMTTAEFERIVAFNSGVAERQAAWEEANGAALRRAVKYVRDFQAEGGVVPEPKWLVPDSDEETEPPAKRVHRASSHGQLKSSSSASAPTAAPPHPPAPHIDGDHAANTELSRLSLMAIGCADGHVPKKFVHAEYAKYLAASPEWHAYLAGQSAGDSGI
ncbi:hypothetical protein CYLTODRAFT_458703 [Cylindrobasidium torrendii FP15055 ss-10]|uniref:Uncharacterized protein n=1 Tax=Cylindrobasidium torrendii FP15055 ss-10 TaxID=1314674 RepID=A0A0D7AX29_9AGAR|nr:hypothetical protein CYLTODRAFT_458703 [Cylindrobasidium torrendii FP15055 ss-10]